MEGPAGQEDILLPPNLCVQQLIILLQSLPVLPVAGGDSDVCLLLSLTALHARTHFLLLHTIILTVNTLFAGIFGAVVVEAGICMAAAMCGERSHVSLRQASL